MIFRAKSNFTMLKPKGNPCKRLGLQEAQFVIVAVLSPKFITGGYAGIDRRPCINSEGGYIAPEAIEFKMKTGWV